MSQRKTDSEGVGPIENDVPIPDWAKRAKHQPRKSTLLQLKVGESFSISDKKEAMRWRNAASLISKSAKCRFAVGCDDLLGWRLWRTE